MPESPKALKQPHAQCSVMRKDLVAGVLVKHERRALVKPAQQDCYRAARLLSTFPSDIYRFNNKAWGLYSPNQVLTHAARAAAKQAPLLWWPRAAHAKGSG